MNIHQFNMPENAEFIYFIGIGGISMSALAMITQARGYRVAGSDRSASAATRRLEQAGILVHIGHEPANCAEADVVVYSAAISEDNPELRSAREGGKVCAVRAAYLGWLMKEYPVRIGIAGTHGKSTTTSMAAEIFLAGAYDPTIVSGAELRDLGGAYRIGGGENFIFEACEYTDSFLSFYPTTAVVLNIELDHVDYFKTMEQLMESFRHYIDIADIAVVNADDPNVRRAVCGYSGRLVSFGLDSPDALYRAERIAYEDGNARFDLLRDGNFVCRAALAVPGRHNVYNALAAAAAAIENHASPEAAARGLANFHGARRRFERKGVFQGAVLYDDYAHHPSEIKATLAAAKGKKNGGSRLWCVYQPHSYSRTVEFFDDFTKSFHDADEVIFADIYVNLESERAAHGLTSADLAAAVENAVYIPEYEAIATYLRRNVRAGDMVFTVGAGDIYRVGDMLLKGKEDE